MQRFNPGPEVGVGKGEMGEDTFSCTCYSLFLFFPGRSYLLQAPAVVESSDSERVKELSYIGGEENP